MKRKHSEDVNNDFSFPPLFPKSRRLDADLLSSMAMGEEVSTTSIPAFEEHREHFLRPSLIPSEEDEKAIVLYDPTNNRGSIFPFIKSPVLPEFSVIVKSDLIPALKDYLYGSEDLHPPFSAEEEAAGGESNRESSDRLAVVPWVAPQHHLTSGPEAENMEVDMMDTEENEGAEGGAERLQQWQQHCMAPQLHQNMAAPITW